MELSKIIKKAMIDNNIKGAKELSDKTGLSYNKIVRIVNGDSSVRLIDVVEVAKYLNLKLKFASE